MATPLSLSNFLSFLLPSNPSPPPPPKTPPLHFSVSTQKPKNTITPMVVAHQDDHHLSSLSSVICPSLAYANTLFFNSAYNVQVVVDDHEPEERLLNRFRREVMRAGVIQECKRRRFYENKQDEKKRKTREAAKRNKRRRNQSRFTPQTRQEVPISKKDNEVEDNWEMPEGDIPY